MVRPGIWHSCSRRCHPGESQDTSGWTGTPTVPGMITSPASQACRIWLSSVDPTGYKAAYSVFATENGPDPQALADMTTPALFLTGAEEPNSTPAMSEALARTAPRGRAQIIAGAAHMMPMTHADEVNAALDRFFGDAP